MTRRRFKSLLEFREAVIIAWAAIRANKLRSGLTTLGVVIGIIAVTLMGTAIAGVNSAFRESIAGIGADVLYIQRFTWLRGEEEWRLAHNRRPLTVQNAREVERLSDYAATVAVESNGQGSITYKRRHANGVWVAGNNENCLSARSLNLQSGRFLTTADVNSGHKVCVIGAALAEKFFPNGGALGAKIKLNDTPYEVIGTLAKQGGFFSGQFDNQVVIPITCFNREFERWPAELTILVKVNDPSQMENAREELRAIMRRIRRVPPGKTEDFAINQQDAIIKFFNTIAGTIGAVGLFITSLSLFVGGIGIMNIMYVSVAERTREIGVRKAIGAKRRVILAQFLVEAGTITFLAGCLGLALAWPMTLALNQFIAAQLPWWLAGVALVVSILTGVISGFLPAWRASRLDPVEALRAE
jgi:putative ABC transport system permease protein